MTTEKIVGLPFVLSFAEKISRGVGASAPTRNEILQKRLLEVHEVGADSSGLRPTTGGTRITEVFHETTDDD